MTGDDDRDPDDSERPRRDRALVVGLVIAAVVVGGYFATGMPGMDHSAAPGAGNSMGSMDHESMALRSLDAEAFAARVSDQAFVANVHTPYDGEIAGTDAFISHDRIAGDSRLPADKDSEILLYCRSGRMSEAAGEALQRAGYSNVAELAGGMDAWEAAGLEVSTRSSAGNG